MRDDPKKCAILVPVHHAIEPECEDALRELASRGYPVIVLRGSSAIDMARNDLANQAMDGGYAETLWIDSDVVFKPDDVEKLRSHGLLFVCGLYPKKGRREFACKFWPATEDIVFGVGGGLRSMQYVGMGFTFIRAEVYRVMAAELKLPRVKGGYTPGKLVTPYFLPMLTVDEDGESEVYLAEDAAFCERARLAGFEVMADTTIRLDHMGRRVWCWEDFAPQTVYDSLKFSMAVEPLVKGPRTGPLSPSGDSDMNEGDLYAKIGRLTLELEAMTADRGKVLKILAEVIGGQCAPERVMVNLTDQQVFWVPVGESIGAPATINGKPECVIASPVQEQPGFHDDKGEVILTGRNLVIRRVEPAAPQNLMEALKTA